jgi:superfamily II DNA or RNA helicase
MGRGSIRSRKEKAQYGYDKTRQKREIQLQSEAPPTDMVITKRQTVTREGSFDDSQRIFNFEHRVAMEFCTGFGKTYAALRLIAEDLTATKGGKKWYILIPRNTIVQTWYDEMDKWGFRWMYKHGFVEIINYSSSHKLEEGRNYCLDEAHNITELREGNMDRVIDKDTRIIAASATIDSEKFTILRSFGFKKKHRIVVTLDQGVEAGAVTDYKIFMLPLKMNELFKKGIAAKNRWLSACKKKSDAGGIEAAIFAQTRQIYNSYQKLLAAQYVVNQFKRRDKVLIYVSNQNFAEQLSRLTGYPVMHSSQKDAERKEIWKDFQEAKFGMLISCYTISEGVTISGVNKCLVVQTRKKDRELIQRLGRILRFEGKEDGEIGQLYLLYLMGTWDENWANSSVKSFDPNKLFEYIIPESKYKTSQDIIEDLYSAPKKKKNGRKKKV